MGKELLAKIIDGRVVYYPKKRRRQSRGEFLANVSAANRLNGETIDKKTTTPIQLKMFFFDSKV